MTMPAHLETGGARADASRLLQTWLPRDGERRTPTIYVWNQGPKTPFGPELAHLPAEHMKQAGSIAYALLNGSGCGRLKTFFESNRDKQIMLLEPLDAVLESRAARHTALELIEYCSASSTRSMLAYSRIDPTLRSADFKRVTDRRGVEVRQWPSRDALDLTQLIDPQLRDLVHQCVTELSVRRGGFDRAVLKSVLTEICLEIVGSEMRALAPSVDVVTQRWMRDKRPRETPPDFIRRCYGPLLDGELTRAVLRRVDPNLEMALRNWLRNNEMPQDLKHGLPTVTDRIGGILRGCTEFGHTPGRAPAQAALARLSAAARRRKLSHDG